MKKGLTIYRLGSNGKMVSQKQMDDFAKKLAKGQTSKFGIKYRKDFISDESLKNNIYLWTVGDKDRPGTCGDAQDFAEQINKTENGDNMMITHNAIHFCPIPVMSGDETSDRSVKHIVMSSFGDVSLVGRFTAIG